MRIIVRKYKYSVFFALACLAYAPAAYSAKMDFPSQQTLRVEVGAESNLEAAKAFVDGMAQRGIAFLGNESMSDEERTAEFRKLLNSSFDMATIGRFALGRNWKAATPAQQAEYQKLFKEMIVKTYSRRFKEYNGQKLEIRSARADGETDIIVNSSIIPPQGAEIAVDWRVRNKGGTYKIVDVIIEGVSMALTQRSDFASVIQRGGGNIEVLLEHLRQQ